MSIIYLNGELVEDNAPLISHRDSGFTTGIGIFDSMLAKDGTLIHGPEHYERIIHDSKIILDTPHPNIFDILPSSLVKGGGLGRGDKAFTNIIQSLLQKNNLERGYARIRTTVTGGIANAPLAPAKTPTILIDVAPCPAPENITPAKCAIITDFPRIAGCILENCKRLDYARSYAARRAAENLGAEEAILTNTDGNIACGATSNIFIEENGTLITPPLSDGVLAGVTRRKLMEERKIIEESISIERLKNANKIYLTNSFVGLRNVILL